MPSTKLNSSNAATPQMALDLQLSDKACFENFYAQGNLQVVNALEQAVSVNDSAAQAPLYFYGISGSGKSHLLFASQRLADKMRASTSDKTAAKLSYLSLNDPYISPEMFELMDKSNIICLDNIDAWAGQDDKEQALFALFEQVKHHQGQLIMSALAAPEQAGFNLKDLVSRLSSGLVYPLHHLDDTQLLAAVTMRANFRGLTITEDVVKYLLTRLPRDTTQVFTVLDKIDRASLIEQRKITIPFLRQLLER